MKLAGFTRNSFVDYPGRIAAVIFLAGCNYDCFFCHNRGIIGANAPATPEEPVWEFLEKRQGLLDAVVVTGGEPTLQEGLFDLITRIKKLGYLCKLDTNGSNPQIVKDLLAAKMLDYVALDIKAPWERYREFCGSSADYSLVLDTLSYLRDSGVDYECRTTYLPQLSCEDIARITRSIAPVKRFALQAYRIPTVYKPTDRFRVMAAGHNVENVKKALESAVWCGGEVILRA